MKVRILGSGPSIGVPSLCFGFGACNPINPKNTRTRTSALVQTDDNINILIDTSPEMRMQLLAAGNPHIDALIYTHCHNDHMGGADDLYGLMMRRTDRIPIYMQQSDADYFRGKLYYLLAGKHKFDIHVIEPYNPFYIGNNKIIPILQEHGRNYANETVFSLGYRLNNFAYSTDVRTMDETAFATLQNLDTWILGGITKRINHKHVNLDRAFEWINQLKPRQTYFTHLCEDWDYDEMCRLLPENIYPAYDGLEININQD